MYTSARLVAVLLATMLHRADLTRARISDRTLRIVSRRTTLRDAFIGNVRAWLEDLGVELFSLDRGGYALVAISALDGARAITARRLISEELQYVRNGTIDEGALWAELGIPFTDEE